MSRLQILPPGVANMIAAGEVVQRPASVVKELMENSVDAGATNVTVIISDSGRTLIQVIDNGCGMSREDAQLCFERHATSKIASAEDLGRILTYGFRGEALASIAAVADITLKTRRAEDESATQVTISPAGNLEVSDASAPVGSNFAIRNLFFNVPARRKFLKSDNVEFRHIVEEFTRVALTRPDKGFTLIHNGREIYVLKPAKSLKFRVLDLLGSSVVGDIVDIDATTSLVKVSGFIGRPDTARKTLGNQFFFVNGRFFRSAYLHKAVMKAYEEFIPEGVTPSYFIYMEVDPESVDVNIHPTKTEIKFEEDSVVFQILYACVKEALGKHSFGASIEFNTEGAVKMPVMSKTFSESRPAQMLSMDFDPSFNPFDSAPAYDAAPGASVSAAPSYGGGIPKTPDYDTNPQHSGGFEPHYGPVTPHESYGKLFEDKVLPTTQVIILHGKYIIAPASSGIMLVHIRRAKERILYEQFLSAASKSERVAQSILFPVQVNVGVQGKLLLDDNAGLLSSLGFDFSPFGDDTVIVNAVPEGFPSESGNVQSMVADLIQIISEGCAGTLQELMLSSMAEKLSVLGASGPADMTSPFEAQHLIDRLLSCDNAEFTISGHRIITIITTEEIEKKL